jgi:hypothetical protein
MNTRYGWGSEGGNRIGGGGGDRRGTCGSGQMAK